MPCNRQNGGSGMRLTGAKQIFHNVIATLKDTLTKKDFPKLRQKQGNLQLQEMLALLQKH